MKISTNFPVLIKSNTLFIVSGAHSAIVYRVKDGEINERESILIEKPKYSDKEGFFEHGGPKVGVRSSGSAYEAKSDHLKKKFIDTLIKELKQIKTTYEDIYLFAPSDIALSIETAMPKVMSKKIKQKISGNFTKVHPTSLLKKIKSSRIEKMEKTLKPINTEVKKILSNKKKLKRSNL